MNEDRIDPYEAVERAARTLTTGIIIAGAVVGLALYSRPAPARFDAFAVGDKIVRVDMRKGTIISCETGKRCELILEHGQRLTVPHRSPPALPKPASAAPPAPAAGK